MSQRNTDMFLLSVNKKEKTQYLPGDMFVVSCLWSHLTHSMSGHLMTLVLEQLIQENLGKGNSNFYHPIIETCCLSDNFSAKTK